MSFQNVSGELYDVDQDALDFLDDFESYPDVYSRVEIDVSHRDESMSQGSSRAWCYVFENPGPQTRALTFMANYDNALSAAQGLNYKPK